MDARDLDSCRDDLDGTQPAPAYTERVRYSQGMNLVAVVVFRNVVSTEINVVRYSSSKVPVSHVRTGHNSCSFKRYGFACVGSLFLVVDMLPDLLMDERVYPEAVALGK